jgi:hypothetical protein
MSQGVYIISSHLMGYWEKTDFLDVHYSVERGERILEEVVLRGSLVGV